jgi:endonuclease YncB( thermonuclease family)
MPMLVIAGEYRIVGAAPDGDSVRFYPDDPTEWDLIPTVGKVKRNTSGGAQLRMDGIDSLETHYMVEGQTLHQPLGLAQEAAAALLRWLGFTSVSRNDRETVIDAAPLAARGYVLTRQVDVYGRCVAFVGRKDAPAPSGTMLHVTPAMLRRTANHRQLLMGMAYPTYYRKLYPDLRDTMTAAVATARRRNRGLWPRDVTHTGLVVKGFDHLDEDAVVMPKLYRRLATFLALGDGDERVDGFLDYLDREDDRVFVRSTEQFTSFDTVVRVDSRRNSVCMTTDPEDLVFEEK